MYVKQTRGSFGADFIFTHLFTVEICIHILPSFGPRQRAFDQGITLQRRSPNAALRLKLFRNRAVIRPSGKSAAQIAVDAHHRTARAGHQNADAMGVMRSKRTVG